MGAWKIVEDDDGFWVKHKKYKTCRHNQGPFSTLEEAQTVMKKQVARNKLWGKFRYDDIRERGKENDFLEEMGIPFGDEEIN